jgi:hypothetical protein
MRLSLRLIVVAAITLTSAGAIGCSLDRDDVVGRYIAELPYGTAELVLNGNGSYEELVTVKPGGRVARHVGRWIYRRQAKQIDLENPLYFDNNFGELSPTFDMPEKGTWTLSARRGAGGVSLGWNPDLDFYFKRVEDARGRTVTKVRPR